MVKLSTIVTIVARCVCVCGDKLRKYNCVPGSLLWCDSPYNYVVADHFNTQCYSLLFSGTLTALFPHVILSE